MKFDYKSARTLLFRLHVVRDRSLCRIDFGTSGLGFNTMKAIHLRCPRKNVHPLTTLCDDFAEGRCRRGSQCSQAHGEDDLLIEEELQDYTGEDMENFAELRISPVVRRRIGVYSIVFQGG